MRMAIAGFALVSTMVFGVSAFAASPLPPTAIPSAAPSVAPGVTPVLTPAATSASPVTAELNDGSKVEFDADATVWVLGADGSKTPAPDGTLTLKDGTPFVVREGKRVSGD